MPGQDGVGVDDVGDFFQDFLPQLLADGGQRFAFAVTQSDAPLDLVAKDTVLRHQILVAEQQGLIHRSRDIREQGFPVHRRFPSAFGGSMPVEYGL